MGGAAVSPLELPAIATAASGLADLVSNMAGFAVVALWPLLGAIALDNGVGLEKTGALSWLRAKVEDLRQGTGLLRLCLEMIDDSAMHCYTENWSIWVYLKQATTTMSICPKVSSVLLRPALPV